MAYMVDFPTPPQIYIYINHCDAVELFTSVIIHVNENIK